jgi:acyl-CoA synthetase (AMP-forming)/AMP-acid ligase II
MSEANDSSESPVATMYDAVRHWAERTPDAPALVTAEGDAIGYRDVARSIAATGATLGDLGIGRTDRVAILHPGGIEMGLAVMGVWGHATAAPLNPNYTLGEFAMYLRDLRVRAMAIADGMDSPARLAAERLGLPIFDILPGTDGARAFVRLRGDPVGPAVKTGPALTGDTALVLTTSGTTTQSKIVPIRHCELVARCRNAGRTLGLRPDDRCLNLMPLYHSHGLNTALGISMVAGSSVAPMPRFDVAGFFGALETLRPTWYTAVFTFHHQIHAHADAHADAIARAAALHSHELGPPRAADRGRSRRMVPRADARHLRHNGDGRDRGRLAPARGTPARQRRKPRLRRGRGRRRRRTARAARRARRSLRPRRQCLHRLRERHTDRGADPGRLVPYRR